MQRVKGFRVGQRIGKMFRWIKTCKQSSSKSFVRLSPKQGKSKICRWMESLKKCAKRICFLRNGSGYVRVGHNPDETRPGYWVPRGHLAIYVGEKEDDACRVLVPLIYFNHPLFGKLLKEAEKIYGFDQPGGIQIPCRISEFESVKTKIAAASGGGNMQLRRSWKSI